MNLIELVVWTAVLWGLCLAAIWFAASTGLPLALSAFFVVFGSVLAMTTIGVSLRRVGFARSDAEKR